MFRASRYDVTIVALKGNEAPGRTYIHLLAVGFFYRVWFSLEQYIFLLLVYLWFRCVLLDAVGRIRKLKSDGTVALIIGRDDIGLRREEVEKCDMLAYISTNPEYPVLNVSHSLAIFLYLLNREKLRTLHSNEKREDTFQKGEMDLLMGIFKKMISKKKAIRDKRAVMSIFRRIIRDTQPNRQELHALITALK